MNWEEFEADPVAAPPRLRPISATYGAGGGSQASNGGSVWPSRQAVASSNPLVVYHSLSTVRALCVCLILGWGPMISLPASLPLSTEMYCSTKLMLFGCICTIQFLSLSFTCNPEKEKDRTTWRLYAMRLEASAHRVQICNCKCVHWK